jgi:outer membrane protein TolC
MVETLRQPAARSADDTGAGRQSHASGCRRAGPAGRGPGKDRGAPLVPALSLSGAAQYSSQSASRSSRNVLAQASYELDFWGKNRNAAASAQALVAASGFDADTVAMTLSASVANGYFTLLSLDERIALAREAARPPGANSI